MSVSERKALVKYYEEKSIEELAGIYDSLQLKYQELLVRLELHTQNENDVEIVDRIQHLLKFTGYKRQAVKAVLKKKRQIFNEEQRIAAENRRKKEREERQIVNEEQRAVAGLLKQNDVYIETKIKSIFFAEIVSQQLFSETKKLTVDLVELAYKETIIKLEQHEYFEKRRKYLYNRKNKLIQKMQELEIN